MQGTRVRHEKISWKHTTQRGTWGHGQDGVRVARIIL